MGACIFKYTRIHTQLDKGQRNSFLIPLKIHVLVLLITNILVTSIKSKFDHWISVRKTIKDIKNKQTLKLSFKLFIIFIYSYNKMGDFID